LDYSQHLKQGVQYFGNHLWIAIFLAAVAGKIQTQIFSFYGAFSVRLDKSRSGLKESNICTGGIFSYITVTVLQIPIDQ
jgi:hypothetical protein